MNTQSYFTRVLVDNVFPGSNFTLTFRQTGKLWSLHSCCIDFYAILRMCLYVTEFCLRQWLHRRTEGGGVGSTWGSCPLPLLFENDDTVQMKILQFKIP